MSDRQLNMEMGNLILKFGSNKSLLDQFDEIVLPAFTDISLTRKYDDTSYFFHQVKPIILERNQERISIGIVGRYIKDTTLTREQIFEADHGLVEDLDSIRSSPSAMFLLILNNHRLVYVKETKNAPPASSFRSTLLSFLRVKHQEFIQSEYDRNAEIRQEFPDRKKVTKKMLTAEIPKPTLELIALTTEEGIEQFVKKYAVLKTIELVFSDRNDENDNEPFFDDLQRRRDALGSKKSTLKHHNSEGLVKEQVISELSEATEQGNQTVKLVGTDGDGDTLRGNNEKFQLRKPLDEMSKIPEAAASELYASFSSLVESGLIKVPEEKPSTRRKILELLRTLF